MKCCWAVAQEVVERGGPHQWAVEASVEHLARLRADVDEVAEWVQVDFAQSLVKLLSLGPSQVRGGSCALP